uniref:Uncharacterized protein n=1 Tax=Lepeophtheirus salmonis TaxID=72036 RepID=A0A0K2U7D0_LEPSM
MVAKHVPQGQLCIYSRRHHVLKYEAFLYGEHGCLLDGRLWTVFLIHCEPFPVLCVMEVKTNKTSHPNVNVLKVVII